jgi:hypothetical protein
MDAPATEGHAMSLRQLVASSKVITGRGRIIFPSNMQEVIRFSTVA